MSTIKEIAKEHVRFKRQLFKLAKSDLIKTYSGAALGWMWAVIRPGIRIFIWWFAIAIGLKAGNNIDGLTMPYFFWLLAGIVVWFYMGDLLTGGAGVFRKYKQLVTKVKFPVSTIPTFFCLSKLIEHFMILLAVMIIFIIAGYEPTVYWLQLPFYTACMFALCLSWSRLAGLLSVVSKDFYNLIKSFGFALFWLSGIIFDINSFDQEWIKDIMLFNPISYVSSGYRNALVFDRWFFEEPMKLACFALVFLIFYFMSIWAYKKLRREIPDIL